MKKIKFIAAFAIVAVAAVNVYHATVGSISITDLQMKELEARADDARIEIGTKKRGEKPVGNYCAICNEDYVACAPAIFFRHCQPVSCTHIRQVHGGPR